MNSAAPDIIAEFDKKRNQGVFRRKGKGKAARASASADLRPATGASGGIRTLKPRRTPGPKPGASAVPPRSRDVVSRQGSDRSRLAAGRTAAAVADADRVVEAHRGGVEEALAPGAAELEERGGLLGALDPLGDDLEPEAEGQADDAGDDRVAGAAQAELGDERPVDLHDVDREPAQVVERRVAGAEVVDREEHARRP